MEKREKAKWAIGGCISTIAVWGIAGKLAWEWTEPQSFWGAIKFTLAWTLIAYPFNALIGYIIDKSGLRDKEEIIATEESMEDHNE